MQISLEQKILTGAGLAVTLLVLLGAGIYWTASRTAETFRWVDHTHRVLYQVENVLTDLLNMQSATRGYLLTGQTDFLIPYTKARATVEADLQLLQELTADNPTRQIQVAKLREAATSLIAITRDQIETRKNTAAAPSGTVLAGKTQMDTIRSLSATIEAAERALLEMRSAETRDQALNTALATMVGGLVSIALVCTAAFQVRRDLRQRLAAEAERDRFFQLSRDLLCVADFNGYFTRVNPAWEFTTGFTAAELTSQPFLEFVHPDDRARTLEVSTAQTTTEAGRDIADFENRYRCKDGSYRWLSWNARAVAEGARIYASARDITAQRTTQEALRDSEARYRTLFDSIDEGYCIIEMIFDARQKPTDYRFLVINPSFEKQTGLHDALGKTMRELAPAHEAHWFETYGRIALTGESLRFQNRAEQLHRWFDVYAFRIGEPASRQVAILFNDITARKEAETKISGLNADLQQRGLQLEAANRELEAFSYSVSHDLRAPLRHIDGFSMLLHKSVPTLDEKSRHYLDTISTASKQMGRLIDDLLSFSRMSRTELHHARLDQTALVASIVRGLRLAPGHPAIEWAIAPLPAVPADEAMFRQVWVNLIDNAVKYSAKTARPRIEIGSRPDPATGELVCYVRDNGAGFDPRYLDKLFGVFQRLHSAAEFDGTGIGLANVRRIVSRHGGRTWAEGAVGQGATFYFSLPATPVADPQPA